MCLSRNVMTAISLILIAVGLYLVFGFYPKSGANVSEINDLKQKRHLGYTLLVIGLILGGYILYTMENCIFACKL